MKSGKMENAVKTKTSVFVLPFDYFQSAIERVYFQIVQCPVFILFLCTWTTIAYLLLFNQRAQQFAASLPYGRYFAKFKSRKMITIYVTILEVVVEVLMALVFAGVSMLITFWLLFEEVTDRKKKLKPYEIHREDLPSSKESKMPVSGKNY